MPVNKSDIGQSGQRDGLKKASKHWVKPTLNILASHENEWKANENKLS